SAMLWEIEIQPKGHDLERDRVHDEYALLTHAASARGLLQRSARGYLLEGDLSGDQAERLLTHLLVDPLVETGRLASLEGMKGNRAGEDPMVTVLLKPGVMDPVALSVVDAARDLGIPLESVRTFRRYYLNEGSALGDPRSPLRKVLANEAIEHLIEGPLALAHLSLRTVYTFQHIRVPLRDLDDAALVDLSRQGQLSLNLAEMRAIQAHFRDLRRDPTDVELETLAQTWSEHCSHKTLKGRIDFDGR